MPPSWSVGRQVAGRPKTSSGLGHKTGLKTWWHPKLRQHGYLHRPQSWSRQTRAERCVWLRQEAPLGRRSPTVPQRRRRRRRRRRTRRLEDKWAPCPGIFRLGRSGCGPKVSQTRGQLPATPPQPLLAWTILGRLDTGKKQLLPGCWKRITRVAPKVSKGATSDGSSPLTWPFRLPPFLRDVTRNL